MRFKTIGFFLLEIFEFQMFLCQHAQNYVRLEEENRALNKLNSTVFMQNDDRKSEKMRLFFPAILLGYLPETLFQHKPTYHTL